ncbi:MAG: TonB-dependent receptor [Proteobacteria bacterium]|nr:TonB-dependent receptor [Pseudomonadota bacterium]
MAHYDPFTSDRRFNWGPLNLVLTPSRRFGTSTQLGYHLSPQVQAHARIAYTRRRSVNQAAPEPLPIGPGGGGTGPLTALTIPSFDPNLAAALPSRYQNFSPFPFALTPETNFVIYRRPLEGGPRIFNQTVNTLVASGGLAGDFSLGSQDFHWDTTFVYGVNRADQIKNNAYDAERIRKALSYNECALDPKCVPLNIFGGQGSGGLGTITREMLDYIQFVQKDVSQQTLIDLTLNITGGIAELPGGTMGFATGVELRRHQGFFQPDGIVARGDTAGIPAAPTRGSIDVAEGYAEVRLPLFDQAGPVDLWDVSGAARVSSYSTSGTQTTYRVGSRLRLVDDVLFRGSWGQGFRAPGIGELFGSPARFDQGLADRCSDFNKMHQDPVKQQEQAQIAARCQQVWNAGILPSDGSYTQANSQLPVTTGGNPELKAETSTSLTASLVYSPSFVSELPGVDRLSLEVTYYRYQINDPIQAINGQVTLDRCVLGNDQAACDRIARVPGGAIQRIDGQLTNFGSISTDGVDFTLSYWSPHTAFGQFRLTSLSSVLLSFSEILPAGSQSGVATIERAGTEVGSPLRAYPRLKSSLILDWLHSPNLRASWTLRYLGSVTESCGRLPDTDLVPGETITYHEKYCTDPQSDERTMPMTFYNNVQVTWSPERLDRRLDFTVGVNNILNQAPPACYSCGRGFDATTYEIPGVFGYVRAGYRL